MSSPQESNKRTRRAVLRGATAGLGLIGTAGAATAQTGDGTSDEVDYAGWFSNVSNFEGTVDRTGQESVSVEVGVEGNTDYFAFGPPAIRVDPGTTVEWQWTGRGGSHNVVDVDGSFESQLTGETGATFTHTFDSAGVYRYYCGPHRTFGMKGAIVVGDATSVAAGSDGFTWSPPGFVGQPFMWLFFGAVSLGAMIVLGGEAVRGVANWRETRAAQADVESTEAEEFEPVQQIGHDEYDPTGTAALILLYFIVLVIMWVFMYFIEFLGGGPTVVG